MSKSITQKKYYAIKSINGKTVNVIYTDWTTCKNKVHGKNAVYKSFTSETEARNFLEYRKNIKIKDSSKKTLVHSGKRCVICEKPYQGKNQSCPSCKQRARSLGRYPLSINNLLYLKYLYKKDDILGYLEKYPEKVGALKGATKNDRKYAKYEMVSAFKDEYSSDTKYKKFESNIPIYVKDVVKKYPELILQTIGGNKYNPLVYCHCNKCGEDICLVYNKLRSSAGHNCSAEISSGEFVVQEFLKEIGIEYKVQRNTLKCINPKTGYQLPYDFELSKYKVIIEVQGEQHYKYISKFHKTIEEFEYSQWKDQVKKEFAINMKYKFLEISYTEINDESYKEKIKSVILV